MEATKVCSLGQITAALFEVGGQYRRNMCYQNLLRSKIGMNRLSPCLLDEDEKTSIYGRFFILVCASIWSRVG
jgi:hypothetical protein